MKPILAYTLAACATAQVTEPAVWPPDWNERVYRIGDLAAGGIDPLRDEQWALDVLRIEELPPLPPDADLCELWVVDTGWGLHEDLNNRWPALGVEGFPAIDVHHGHGTAVRAAVTITGNGLGLAAIAATDGGWPGGSVAGLDSTRGGSGTAWSVAMGILEAVVHGADVISVSIQGSYAPEYDVVMELCRELNIWVFIAAGNYFCGSSPNPDCVAWPGAHPYAVTISALDPTLTIADYSSAGPQVDFCGPATHTWAPISVSGRWDPVPCADCYVLFGGTSAATPMNATLGALIRTHQPDLTWEQMRQALRYGSVDLGPDGWDPWYGAGMPTSRAVRLVRWNRADFNEDGVVDSTDAKLFQRAYAAGEPEADFDLDGALTMFDFLLFSEAF